MKLEPCPFCGGEAIFFPVAPPTIRCTKCSSEMKVGISSFSSTTVNVWNQRHTGWVSVDERLPEYRDGLEQSHAILVTEDFDEYEIAWYAHGRWVIHSTFNITHWMEIPQPPKAKEDK